jgi:hypothetical protein
VALACHAILGLHPDSESLALPIRRIAIGREIDGHGKKSFILRIVAQEQCDLSYWSMRNLAKRIEVANVDSKETLSACLSLCRSDRLKFSFGPVY